MEAKISGRTGESPCTHAHQKPDSVGVISGKAVTEVSVDSTEPKQSSKLLRSKAVTQRPVVSCQQKKRELIDSLNLLYQQCWESKETKNQWQVIKDFNQTLSDLLQINPVLRKYLVIREQEIDGIRYARLTQKGITRALELRFPDQIKSGHLEHWHLDFQPDKVCLGPMKTWLRSQYGEKESSLMYKDDDELRSLIKTLGKGGRLNQLTYPRSLVCLGAMLCNKLHGLSDEEDCIVLVDFGVHCSVLYLRKKSSYEYRILLLDSLEAFLDEDDYRIHMDSEMCLVAIQAAVMDLKATANMYYIPGSRQSSKVHCYEFAFHDIEVLLESPMIPKAGYQASPAKGVGVLSVSQAFCEAMFENRGCGISINNQPSLEVSAKGVEPFVSCLKEVLAPRMGVQATKVPLKEEFRCRLLKLGAFPVSFLDFTQSTRELERIVSKLPPSEIKIAKSRIEKTSGLARTDKGEVKRLNLAAQLRSMRTIISLAELS
ncbi:hypothetical protein [Sansalvadorimonas verongulae]|uniref:hypothetical protein n=1 Tax=Sansalvadorimonas verongulae TaxID=2172824 RepID=UPI0012BCB53D|nr:hypothetical protein [Sansalvadorimonas verongulae]MTI15185.1 hypothetical protein [Sansalvadorimonas verongulae]